MHTAPRASCERAFVCERMWPTTQMSWVFDAAPAVHAVCCAARSQRPAGSTHRLRWWRRLTSSWPSSARSGRACHGRRRGSPAAAAGASSRRSSRRAAPGGEVGMCNLASQRSSRGLLQPSGCIPDPHAAHARRRSEFQLLSQRRPCVMPASSSAAMHGHDGLQPLGCQHCVVIHHQLCQARQARTNGRRRGIIQAAVWQHQRSQGRGTADVRRRCTEVMLVGGRHRRRQMRHRRAGPAPGCSTPASGTSGPCTC